MGAAIKQILGKWRKRQINYTLNEVINELLALHAVSSSSFLHTLDYLLYFLFTRIV
jgi:hypothetical protein